MNIKLIGFEARNLPAYVNSIPATLSLLLYKHTMMKKKTANNIRKTAIMILQAPLPYHPWALSTSNKTPADRRSKLPNTTAPGAIILGIICTRIIQIIPIPRAINKEILFTSYVSRKFHFDSKPAF